METGEEKPKEIIMICCHEEREKYKDFIRKKI